TSRETRMFFLIPLVVVYLGSGSRLFQSARYFFPKVIVIHTNEKIFSLLNLDLAKNNNALFRGRCCFAGFYFTARLRARLPEQRTRKSRRYDSCGSCSVFHRDPRRDPRHRRPRGAAPQSPALPA